MSSSKPNRFGEFFEEIEDLADDKSDDEIKEDYLMGKYGEVSHVNILKKGTAKSNSSHG